MGAAAPISLGVPLYPGFDPATLAAWDGALRRKRPAWPPAVSFPPCYFLPDWDLAAAASDSSADFCSSSVLMVIWTKPTFMVSQVSTAFSSAIFFATSAASTVGMVMPGMGNAIG